MPQHRAGTSYGVLAIIATLVLASPLTVSAAVDDKSPHNFHELEWTLDVSGDSLIPAGAKRLVTLSVRNPKDYPIYLFGTSSHTTPICLPSGTCTTTTVTDYGPVTDFLIGVREIHTRAAVLDARRPVDETIWFPAYATITPTGQRTLQTYPNLASRPIFSYLLDTAGIPEGEYEVLISASHRSNGPANYDTFIGSRRIQIIADNGSTMTQRPPETPWQTNGSGTLQTDVAWNYNMGYQFVPQVSGKITKLGGFFNGTKTVRLYDSSGSTLAFTDVTAANTWVYKAVNPVAVTAGQTYTVAVNLAGSGGSYRSLGTSPLPKTFGQIQILKSVYRATSDLIPTSGNVTSMYGQADIEFVPDR